MSNTLDLAHPLWTIDDLAAYLSVPVRTIYDWRRHGGGPRARKVGKHLRFHPADVGEWLDSQAETVHGSDAPSRAATSGSGSVSDDEFWAA